MSSSKGDYTVLDVGLVSSSLEIYAVLLSFGLDVKNSRDRRGFIKNFRSIILKITLGAERVSKYPVDTYFQGVF